MGRTCRCGRRRRSRGYSGALLADHAYVEAVGAIDPKTRRFIDIFTGFWTGVDEAGMARALSMEQRADLSFAQRVFLSLNNDYNTDADDVAREYVKIVRRDSGLKQALRGNRALRELRFDPDPIREKYKIIDAPIMYPHLNPT